MRLNCCSTTVRLLLATQLQFDGYQKSPEVTQILVRVQHVRQKTLLTLTNAKTALPTFTRCKWDIHCIFQQCPYNRISNFRLSISKSTVDDHISIGETNRRQSSVSSTIKCRRIRDKMSKDTIATHVYEFAIKRWFSTINVDFSAIKVNFPQSKLFYGRRLFNTLETLLTTSGPQCYGSAPYLQFPVFGEESGVGRVSRAARENETKFQTLISPKRLDETWHIWHQKAWNFKPYRLVTVKKGYKDV